MYELHGNHKSKVYHRYTKNKEERTQIWYWGKLSNQRTEAKRRRNREPQKQLENRKMAMPIDNHLNVNALNTPIKRLMALIVIKGSRQKKHIISINIYTVNVGALEYIK